MKIILGKCNGVKVKFAYSEEEFDCGIWSFANKYKLFKGTLGEVYGGKSAEDRLVLYIGLGNRDSVTLDDYRTAAHSATKYLIAKGLNNVDMTFEKPEFMNTEAILAFAEGVLHGEYVFDKFKTDRKESSLTEVNFAIDGEIENLEMELVELNNKMSSVMTARDLINEPAMYMYPETLAQHAKDILEPLGVKVTVYGKAEIEELGMQGFLSVARGSSREPKLIVMEYGDVKDSPIALVGKGLTYDSGGYSIKPSDSMKTMQSDMGGAATVIGAMKAIASNKLEKDVVAVIAACENMISGDSYKPGDLIYTMSGKTIEVDNTDAEGRVTLADAVYYATTNYKPSRLIDLATLTGACVVALGEVYTGAITNDSDFLSAFSHSVAVEDEKVWELPNDTEYKSLNDSEVADIKNSGGRYGGTITAGQFVGEFLAEDIPWIHLDIAGTAFLSKGRKYLPKGGTGVMVKSLYNFVKHND